MEIRCNRSLGFRTLLVTSLFLLPMSVVHATGDVKKPSFENIRKLADQTEESEAGRRLNVSPQKLTEEIENARVELEKYLAAKPDDIEALLLAARLGRAEIMAGPIALQEVPQMEAKRRQRVEELANYCDRALVAQPNNGEAYYWKARLYGIRHFGMRDGQMAWVYVDLNLAEQLAKKAVDLDSQNILYRETLALDLVRNQKPNEAMEVMRGVAGGQHPIYLLLSDKKHLPLPERAVLLRKETEDVVQGALDQAWKKDYPELRVFQYVIPMSAQEVEDFYRRSWPDFKFFKAGTKKMGTDKNRDLYMDSFAQLLFSRDTSLAPAAKKKDIPNKPEGITLDLGEVHHQEVRTPPFPIPVGDPYCLLTVVNYRPTKQP
jgi:hypothetical protein